MSEIVATTTTIEMRRALIAALIAGPVVGLAIGRGCSSKVTFDEPPLSGTRAATVSSRSSDGARSSEPFDPLNPFASCTKRTDVSDVPPGWQLWPDYDPCCAFFVPSTAADSPAPVAWRSCDVASTVKNGCRQLVIDWQPWSDGTSSSPWVKGDVGHDGHVTLQLSRAIGTGAKNSMLRLIADADGPVHQAIFEADTTMCTLGQSALQDGRYLYHLVRGTNAASGSGALAGMSTDSRPTVFVRYDDASEHEFAVGLPGVLEMSIAHRLQIHAWRDPGKTTPVVIPDEDRALGLQYNQPFFSGDALFWSANSKSLGRQRVWTALEGTKDLLSFGSDATHGAYDLGTDGRDLVWTQGEGRNDAGKYESVSILTAPFALTSAKVRARRLRSETSKVVAGFPFIVGCGYAARRTQLDGVWRLRVVRLSDGVSWLLAPEPNGLWQWGAPVAISCSEVFMRVGLKGSATIARVRLDALGAELPAD